MAPAADGGGDDRMMAAMTVRPAPGDEACALHGSLPSALWPALLFASALPPALALTGLLLALLPRHAERSMASADDGDWTAAAAASTDDMASACRCGRGDMDADNSTALLGLLAPACAKPPSEFPAETPPPGLPDKDDDDDDGGESESVPTSKAAAAERPCWL